MNEREKKICITGAAGFLGSQLAIEFIRQGHQVIGIDNLMTGREVNVKSIFNHPNFHFIQCDVSSPKILQMKELTHVNRIYHLASPASPKFYQAAPFETMQVNVAGTRNMLELACRNQAKIVYTSTSEVYGNPLIPQQHEGYYGNVNTWGPRACYDESKRLGEVYCYEYLTRKKVQVKVARIFNTYSAGLRNDDGRVISNFVSQALLGRDITVYGDGLQTRSFCYADDTLRALQLMMESDAATGAIMNIGNPESYTILEVAKIVKRLTHSNSHIIFKPLPKDDPKQRCPNIDKAIKILGWKPEIDLEEGLKRTIQVYRQKLLRRR